MKRAALAMTLAIAAAAAPLPRLAVGDALPPLEGEFLTGRPALLPRDSSGRVVLLLLGFSYESRFAVEAWARRFRNDFATDRNATFFEVPIIGGLARLGKWFIDNGMRKGTPPADRENVITVYGGVDPWKQRVGFSDPKAAYLILLDQRGKIVRLAAGNPDEERYQLFASDVRGLLAREPR